MLCANCSTSNSDEAARCVACDTLLPGRDFSLALAEVEKLISDGKLDEANTQITNAELLLATLRLNNEQLNQSNARLLVLRAKIYLGKGQYQLSEDQVRKALNLLDDTPANARLLASAFSISAGIASYNDDINSAKQYMAKALDAARVAGERRTLSSLLSNQANLEMMSGNPDQAITLYGEALTHAETSGNLVMVSTITSNLSYLYAHLGQYAMSLELGRKALAVAEQNGDPTRIVYALEALGEAILRRGDLDEATAILQRALKLTATHNIPSVATELYTHLIEIAWLKGNYKEMGELTHKAISTNAADRRFLILWYAMQIHAYLGLNDTAGASWAYQNMLKEQQRHNAVESVIRNYLSLTAPPLLSAARGNWEVAQKDFNEAIAAADKDGDTYGAAQARLLYAEAMLDHAPQLVKQALELLNEALAIFSEIGTSREQERTTSLITRATQSGQLVAIPRLPLDIPERMC